MAAHDGASSSGSSSTYDVFLSFRGEDTRNNFTGFLHCALEREGINVFIDSEGLWGGEEIQTALLDAIQQSKISILVFSKGYADSKWCLMELVEIIQCHRSNDQKVLPIFLDVEPRDVRHQTGSFEGSFKKHENEYDTQKIQSWKDALTEVGRKKGYELKQVNGNQAELLKLIVDWALSELSSNRLSDVKNPVGLDARVDDLLSRLKDDSNDVRSVGICGIGGMGKTTIATALYNQIFKNFEMSCFLANVREEASSGPNGVVSLQEKLIYSVSKKEEKICIVDGGKQLIKEKLHGKKVLVILDDVDCYSQLKDLAIDSILFGPGSRIIITTRDEHILNVAKVDRENIYRPKELDDKQSLQLFSLHAFSSDRPPIEYLQLSRNVIRLAGGLPLTLEVLGSTFSDKENREEEVWKSMLQELKRIPHDDVYKKLKISYDKLNDNEKSILLDAACFFVGWRKEYVISLWDACGFNPISAIKKLTQRCFLKFETLDYHFSERFDALRMHDQIQAMGRGIVYEESPTKPSKRSRLWSHEELLEAIEEPEGAQALEVIILRKGPPVVQRLRGHFATMSKLRILINEHQRNADFLDLPHLPPNLKCFTWNDLIVPANCYHKKLVHMDLSRSIIREAWTNMPQNENKRFQKLKVLHLRECDVSHESLDFSWFPYLETLNLRGCRNMVNLHKSIGDLKSLVELDLRETKIEELPNSICSLSSLKVLNLKDCSSLKNLPESIGDLKSLVELDLRRTEIEKIPSSIYKLSCLKVLNLKRCSSLKNFLDSIGNLKSLVRLDLDETKVEEIQSRIYKLSCLEVLNLKWCSSFKNLPESIGDLKALIKLNLGGTKIEEIPSSIYKLSCLKVLILKDCSSLKNLPDSIGDLKSLIELDLERTNIEEIPSSIYKLSFLKVLNLRDCSSLKNLPDSIGDLKSLIELNLERTKIEEIPSSIYKLSCLKVLILNGCSSLKNFPDSSGDLKSLVRLDLDETKIEEIRSRICKLNKLPNLNSSVELVLSDTKIKEASDGVSLSEKLEELRVRNCHNLVKLPISWGRMRCLHTIDLTGTRILLPLDDSIILLPSLVELRIGNNLESSLPTWIGGLPQLKYLRLEGCTKLESIPDLPSTLTTLDVTDCISLQTLPDLSSLKQLRFLRLIGCEKLKEIRGLEGTESLDDLYVSKCKTLTDTPKWKVHGQGTLLVDEMSRGFIDNYSFLNVNDGIDKGLILCLVFNFQDIDITVQEGQLVDITLSITVNLCRRQKHTRVRCRNEVLIEGVECSSKRDIIYVHHFKGFDWFGIPLQHGIDAIEVQFVCGRIKSDNEEQQPIRCKVKFWKVLLESMASEQQQQISNQEEESITTTAKRMVADFFNWSDDEDHERSPHFVPTQQVGSTTHEKIHHFTSSSNALETEGSSPIVPQQADEEGNDLWLGAWAWACP